MIIQYAAVPFLSELRKIELDFKLSMHAREEMQRRNIPPGVVESVLNHPQQILSIQAGKKIYQSKVDFGTGKEYLVRIVMNDAVAPPIVVTLYRTSKIDKYWRQP